MVRVLARGSGCLRIPRASPRPRVRNFSPPIYSLVVPPHPNPPPQRGEGERQTTDHRPLVSVAGTGRLEPGLAQVLALARLDGAVEEVLPEGAGTVADLVLEARHQPVDAEAALTVAADLDVGVPQPAGG